MYNDGVRTPSRVFKDITGKAILLYALLLLLTPGCARQTDDSAAPEGRESPAVVIAAPAALSTPTYTDAPAEDTASSATGNVLQAAEAYRSVYESVFTGDGVSFSLPPDAMESILDCLGSLGYAAIDYAGDFHMRNTAQVTDFFDAVADGRDAELSIYEICTDAGILCHTLRCSGDGRFVTRTRLAWLSDGSIPLQGTIPTVTYSDTYKITELSLSDGILYYAYDMPDNPPGSNHDGHIDTEVTLSLGE